MTDTEFQVWLHGVFCDDVKAGRLLTGADALPDTLSDAQREFMDNVIAKGRLELGITQN